MNRNQPFVTVRDPRDSVWQSMVERVARQRTRISREIAIAPADALGRETRQADQVDRLVDAANAAVFEMHADDQDQKAVPPAFSVSATRDLAAGSALETTRNCASLALQLAKAKVFGTDQEVKALENDFNFSTCDPFWSDCIEEYVNHYKLWGGLAPRPVNPSPLLSYTIPSNAVVAIVGDWGTGEPRALEVLSEIRARKPDILLHLGDIYYSATEDEVEERFQRAIETVFGASRPRVFSLCGNHDLYAGGTGYYRLVSELGQGSSYFAIQNDDWRFIAMDTGLNDHDPFKVNSTATFLDPSDAAWVRDSVERRRTQDRVLLPSPAVLGV